MSGTALPPIQQAYLLCTDVPCYQDVTGARFLDPLWHKDLLEHVRYLTNLTVACPFVYTGDASRLVPIDGRESRLSNVRFTAIPRITSLRDAVGKLPALFSALWQVIGEADIYHAGVASWPIALVWVGLPIARLKGKFVVIVVENSGWRIEGEVRPTLRRRLRAIGAEALNKWCVEHCDLAIFTHAGYRSELLSPQRSHGHVIPASWIDGRDVLTDDQADQVWQSKLPAHAGELHLLFVGRLEAEKGIPNLLKAIQRIARSKLPVKLDILGSGPLLESCRTAASNMEGPTSVRLLSPVEYGPELFSLIRAYDGLVIPSVSGEQPRILFDAFSQAVPVLVTPTDGLRDWVQAGATGLIAVSGDIDSLADVMKHALEIRPALARMGMSALQVARRWTHTQMHTARWELLAASMRTRGSRSR